MTVRIYRSTDASAPTLSGTSGALLTVLDAVLVNGYGSKTAAGWTIAYTGTNLRQYAMAAGGTGCQLYINDTGPGAGAAREARINGFKTGTAIGTGTGQFPSTGQMTAPSGAVVVRKSTTADSTARPWTIIADGNTLYMFIETGDNTAPFAAIPWMFGDFFSYSSTDTSNCIIIGRTIENIGVFTTQNIYTDAGWAEHFSNLSAMTTTGLTNTLGGHYVCASYTNTGGSVPVGKHSDQTKMGSQHNGTCMFTGYLGYASTGSSNTGLTWFTGFNYPNFPDSGLYMAPIYIHHNGFVRGYFKGLWCPLQHHPLSHNDTFSATGSLNGKSMVVQDTPVLANNTQSSGLSFATGQIFIEYSDTWS